MTTKELIGRLSQLNQDSAVSVCLRYQNGDHKHVQLFDKVEVLVIHDADSEPINGTEKAVLISTKLTDDDILDFYDRHSESDFYEDE